MIHFRVYYATTCRGGNDQYLQCCSPRRAPKCQNHMFHALEPRCCCCSCCFLRLSWSRLAKGTSDDPEEADTVLCPPVLIAFRFLTSHCDKGSFDDPDAAETVRCLSLLISVGVPCLDASVRGSCVEKYIPTTRFLIIRSRVQALHLHELLTAFTL
jgi:hypothetical protein